MAADPTQVAEVARMIARLSHRFADREAILWRAGYDEASWTTLEAEATRLLLAEADRGADGAIIAFARALLEARAALLFAAPQEREVIESENATTLPRGAALLRAAQSSNGNAASHTFADHETTTSEGTLPFVMDAIAQVAAPAEPAVTPVSPLPAAAPMAAKPSPLGKTMSSAFSPAAAPKIKR